MNKKTLSDGCTENSGGSPALSMPETRLHFFFSEWSHGIFECIKVWEEYTVQTLTSESCNVIVLFMF